MQPNHSHLKKISQLEILVNIDKTDNTIKEVAKLFLTAANDWDTSNQTEIFDFVMELKQFFGSPLTRERILNKPLESAWRSEAGSSILQMIDLYERCFQQSNFDQIINDLFLYYEQQMQFVDFIADLKYFTIEEGGRKTPVFSGHRPQIKFEFSDIQTSGQQLFLNKDIVHPGDSVEATIRLLVVECFANTLTEGMTFEFKEGSKIIGIGQIKHIVNEKLRLCS